MLELRHQVPHASVLTPLPPPNPNPNPTIAKLDVHGDTVDPLGDAKLLTIFALAEMYVAPVPWRGRLF